MAKGKKQNTDDGSHVPYESVELDGDIITAAKSTMAAVSFEEGYGEQPGSLHMRNGIAAKRVNH